MGESSRELRPQQGHPGSWRRRCCFCSSILCGLLTFALGFWLFGIYERFTPVYNDVECGLGPIGLKDVKWEGLMQNMTIQVYGSVTCENPNPYAVEVSHFRPQKVWMGPDRIPAATVLNLTDTTLEAMSTSNIGGYVTIRPTKSIFGPAFGLATGVETTIYFQNDEDLELQVPFFFGLVGIKQHFIAKCGFNLKMFFTEFYIGSVMCAEDWDSLVVPPVEEVPEEYKTEADREPREEDDFTRQIRQANLNKNIFLGSAVAMSFLGACLLLFVCPCCCPCCRRRRHCCFCFYKDADEEDRGDEDCGRSSSEESVSKKVIIRRYVEYIVDDDKPDLVRIYGTSQDRMPSIEEEFYAQDDFTIEVKTEY